MKQQSLLMPKVVYRLLLLKLLNVIQFGFKAIYGDSIDMNDICSQMVNDICSQR